MLLGGGGEVHVDCSWKNLYSLGFPDEELTLRFHGSRENNVNGLSALQKFRNYTYN